MKLRAIAVAGALAVLSTAFPRSAAAETYEFWYAYQAGGLAMLCDLHMNGIISTNVLQTAVGNFTSPDSDVPQAATRDAIKAVQEYEEFDNCPLKLPAGRNFGMR